MLLMVEKGIRGGICHSVYKYAKANNKYMKNYDKNKESSYLSGSEDLGWKVPGLNSARRSAGLREPTSLRSSR